MRMAGYFASEWESASIVVSVENPVRGDAGDETETHICGQLQVLLV